MMPLSISDHRVLAVLAEAVKPLGAHELWERSGVLSAGASLWKLKQHGCVRRGLIGEGRSLREYGWEITPGGMRSRTYLLA